MLELVEFTLFFLALGVFAGIMAGLLGVGGGLIIVPGVAWVLALNGVDPGVVMHLAIGTSLATIVVTSLSSIRAHHARRAVRWPVFQRLSPGIVVGALIGARIAHWLPSGVLKTVFGVFVLLIAAQMAFGAKPAPHRSLPGRPGTSVAGVVIGAISAIVGIGGGSLTVPFLSWCNVQIREAVATSAACGLPIAIAGAAGFAFNGWNHAELPAWSIGYISLPALLAIAVASMLAAPFGAKLAHTLPTAMLKRVFAVFLASIGTLMLVT